MHGVGTQWTSRSFNAFNLPAFHRVPSQVEPDPEFPTVRFPNPEEKGVCIARARIVMPMAAESLSFLAQALTESQRFADANNCCLIIANDPDADRLAVAEKDNRDGQWHVFSGNEIGVLLGWWQIFNYKRRSGQSAPAAVLASIVSSRMLRAIARAEGLLYCDTLTGDSICFF